MPKSHLRYKDTIVRHCAWGPCSGTAPSISLNDESFVRSTPPRKVSFEDKQSDSKSSICSDDTVLTKNDKGKQISERKERGREILSLTRRKRSLLVRPTTSLSLVDLARSVVEDDVSSMTGGQDDADLTEERKSKRIRSLSLSPRSVISKPELSSIHQHCHLWSLQASAVEESKGARTSPWGHFIDMVPDEGDSFRTAAYPNFNAILKSYRRTPSRSSYSKLQSRSRKGPNPYGEYEGYTTRKVQPAALSFIHFHTDSNLVHVMPKAKNHFRLTTRSQTINDESPADRLIGVFSELQLRQEEQKASLW